jgi:hypothetical protein
MVKIESDRDFFETQERLPRTKSQNDCYMIDITGQCNAGCRSCYSRGGDHRTLAQFAEELIAVPSGSRVLISGGEPLQRPDYLRFVRLVADVGMHPVLLTNGAGLTRDALITLVENGLSMRESPQVAVSLGLPGTNTTFDEAYRNLQQIKVADIAFTVSELSEIEQVQDIVRGLKGHFDSICIRTAWDGSTPGLFLSDMVKSMPGLLLDCPTLHGYRNAMVINDGIFYKFLSWPTWEQWDTERYSRRGVWYQGDNVVNTLVKRHVAAFSV